MLGNEQASERANKGGNEHRWRGRRTSAGNHKPIGFSTTTDEGDVGDARDNRFRRSSRHIPPVAVQHARTGPLPLGRLCKSPGVHVERHARRRRPVSVGTSETNKGIQLSACCFVFFLLLLLALCQKTTIHSPAQHDEVHRAEAKQARIDPGLHPHTHAQAFFGALNRITVK